jgi:hypothetical protein
MRINRTVEVFGIAEYQRVNYHVPSQPTETFLCITMADNDANVFVTYTAEYTVFAQSVKVGDTFRLGAIATEKRENESGEFTKVIRCQIGGYCDDAAEKREAKKIARLQKLGL